MRTPNFKAILSEYDSREAEIKHRILPDLAQRLPAREYRRIERDFLYELAQMEVRRPILGALLELEDDS